MDGVERIERRAEFLNAMKQDGLYVAWRWPGKMPLAPAEMVTREDAVAHVRHLVGALCLAEFGDFICSMKVRGIQDDDTKMLATLLVEEFLPRIRPILDELKPAAN